MTEALRGKPRPAPRPRVEPGAQHSEICLGPVPEAAGAYWVVGSVGSSDRLRAYVGRDRVVSRIQRCPERGQSRNGDDGNESRDETVFDRRRTAPVRQQSLNQGAHVSTLRDGISDL